MIKKIAKTILIVSLLLPVGCGYKVINKTNQNNFSIVNIESTGNRRINYILKNNLLINSKENSENILDLKLNSKKTKEIKEKNIKNQITKYKISINVEIKFNLNNSNKTNSINSSFSGDYLVAENHSSTLSNEKTVTENLVENISNDIKNKISSIINDL